MACRTNSLGVYKKLLNEINSLKSNNSNGKVELTYFIPEDLNVAGKLPSQLLKVEVFNAFKLWENYFNLYYTKNGFHEESLKLSFNQTLLENKADFIILSDNLESSTKRAEVSKSSNDVISIVLNKQLDHELPGTRGKVYALNSLLHYIGKALGFISSASNSLNNSVFLFANITKVNKLFKNA